MAIEVPTLLTYLDDTFKAPWAKFLHEWDSIVISIFIGILISLLFHFGLRKKEMQPTGLQNLLEWLTEGLNALLTEVLGKDGRKYIPLIGTLFIYILTMNLFGLVPLMKAPSANINVTIALAIVVFCYIQYRNFKNLGVKGFLYHMAGSPTSTAGWIMTPLMFPLELLTQISRPVTLALRLFGNIMGEETLIAYFTLAGIFALSFLHFEIPIGLPFQLPFMMFAILTSTMQAMVFTLLTAVYILLSEPHHETDH